MGFHNREKFDAEYGTVQFHTEIILICMLTDLRYFHTGVIIAENRRALEARSPSQLLLHRERTTSKVELGSEAANNKQLPILRTHNNTTDQLRMHLVVLCNTHPPLKPIHPLRNLTSSRLQTQPLSRKRQDV